MKTTGIDWEIESKKDIELFRDDPALLLAHVLKRHDWTTYITLDVSGEYLNTALKFDDIKDTLFDDLKFDEFAQVIGHSPDKNKLLRMMAKKADEDANIQKFGLFLLENTDKFSWVFRNISNLLLILPPETMEILITSFVPLSEFNDKSNKRECLKLALTGEYSYKKLKSSKAVYLFDCARAHNFLAPKKVYRKDFNKVVRKLIPECTEFINSLDTKTQKDILELVTHSFASVLLFTNEELIELVIEAIRKIKAQTLAALDTQFDTISFLTDFPKELMKYERDITEIVLQNITDLGESDELGLMGRKALTAYVIVKGRNFGTKKSEEVLKHLYKYIKETAASEFVESGDPWYIREIRSNVLKEEGPAFSFSQFEEIVMNVIKELKEKKAELSKLDSNTYPLRIGKLLGILRGQEISDIMQLASQNDTDDFLFQLFDASVRDDLVMEAVYDPEQPGVFAPWIKRSLTHVLSSMMLQLSRVGEMKRFVPEKGRSKLDKYGFSADGVSIFEVFLTRSKFNDSKNKSFFEGSFRAYSKFMHKCLMEAYKEKDSELKRLAVGVYKRLCTLLFTKMAPMHSTFILKMTCTVASNPLALAAGYEVEEEKFVDFMFKNVFNRLQNDSSVIPMPQFSILITIVNHSFNSAIEGLDRGCAAIVKRLIRSVEAIPSSDIALDKLFIDTPEIGVIENESEIVAIKKRILDAKFSAERISIRNIHDRMLSIENKTVPIAPELMEGAERLRPKAFGIGGQTLRECVEYAKKVIVGYKPQEYSTRRRALAQYVIDTVRGMDTIDIQFTDNERENFCYLIPFCSATASTIASVVGEDKAMHSIATECPLDDLRLVYNGRLLTEKQASKEIGSEPKIPEEISFKKQFYNSSIKLRYKESLKKFWKDIEERQKELEGHLRELVEAMAETTENIKSLPKIPSQNTEYLIRALELDNNDVIKMKEKAKEKFYSQKPKLAEPNTSKGKEALLSAICSSVEADQLAKHPKAFKKICSLIGKFSAEGRIWKNDCSVIGKLLSILINDLLQSRSMFACLISGRVSYSMKFSSTAKCIERLCRAIDDRTAGKIEMKLFEEELNGICKLSEREVLQAIGPDNLKRIRLPLFKALLAMVEQQNFPSTFFSATRSYFFGDVLEESIRSFFRRLKDRKRYDSAVVLLLKGLIETKGSGLALRAAIEASLRHVNRISEEIVHLLQRAARESTHVEARYAVALYATRAFGKMAGNQMKPVHVDDLFEAVRAAHEVSRGEVTSQVIVSMCNESVRSRITSDSFFAELLAQQPQCYLKYYGAFPSHGAYKEIYERFVSSFVVCGLLEPREQVVELTIEALSALKLGDGELLEKIAPFVTQGFHTLKPSRDSLPFLRFGVPFALRAAHQRFEDVPRAFIESFDELGQHMDRMSGAKLKQALKREGAANVTQGIEDCFRCIGDSIASHADSLVGEAESKEDIKAASEVCGRAYEKISKMRLKIRLPEFTAMRSIIKAVGSKEFGAVGIAGSDEDHLSAVLKYIEAFKTAPELPPGAFAGFTRYSHAFGERHLEEIGEWDSETDPSAAVIDLLGESVRKHVKADDGIADALCPFVFPRDISKFPRIIANIEEAKPMMELNFSNAMARGETLFSNSRVIEPIMQSRAIENPLYTCNILGDDSDSFVNDFCDSDYDVFLESGSDDLQEKGEKEKMAEEKEQMAERKGEMAEEKEQMAERKGEMAEEKEQMDEEKGVMDEEIEDDGDEEDPANNNEMMFDFFNEFADE